MHSSWTVIGFKKQYSEINNILPWLKRQAFHDMIFPTGKMFLRHIYVAFWSVVSTKERAHILIKAACWSLSEG